MISGIHPFGVDTKANCVQAVDVRRTTVDVAVKRQFGRLLNQLEM
jgi:hypothetical protein